MGKIEINSLVKTVKEKRTADGILIKVGSLGYVLNIKQSNDKILYLIELSSSETGCPIEVFYEDEIEIAKQWGVCLTRRSVHQFRFKNPECIYIDRYVYGIRDNLAPYLERARNRRLIREREKRIKGQ